MSPTPKVKKLYTAMLAAGLLGGTINAMAEAGFAIEEIVVTAQKRAQSMQDIGIAMTAFSGDQLKELGLSQPKDLAAQTPGVDIKNSLGNSNPVITIRGIGMNDYTANTAPSAAVHVNEVFLGSPAYLSFQMFDIERVEVLKGPQGTLFGRNTTAGAVNFITNKPSQEFEAYADISYGNYNTLETEVAIGGGLTDNLAGRFAFITKNSDGHQELRGTGSDAGFALDPSIPALPAIADEDNYGGMDVFAWRGSLSLAASDNLDIDLTLHGSRDRSEQLLYDLEGTIDGYTEPDNDPYSSWSNDKPEIDAEAFGASVHINWDLGFATLTSITGYEAMDRIQGEGDTLPIRRGETVYQEDLWQITQEVRLTSNADGDVSWIVGAFWSEDEVDFHKTMDFSDWALFGPGTTLTATVVDVDYTQTGDSAAVFGHTEWQFNDTWKLTAGLRYTKEDKNLTGWTNDTNPYGLSVLGDVFSTPINYNNDYATDDISGKVALDWTPTEDTLVYASVSKGFKSGGFDGSTILNSDAAKPYDEEVVIAYEVGFKTTLLDSSLQLNGAAFLYDYRDMQVTKMAQTVVGTDSVRSNADQVKISGAELELWWKPASGLDIKAGASYLASEVTSWGADLSTCGVVDMTCDAYAEQVNTEGNHVPDAPRLTFNGMIRYQWGLANGMTMASVADVNYNDSTFKDVGNTLKTEDYWLGNARLSLSSQDKAWSTSLWVKNIGDKRYVTNTLDILTDVKWNWYGMPRTYGMSVRYNWQ